MPTSQHRFSPVSSGGTLYQGLPNNDASAGNTYAYQQQHFAAYLSDTLPSLHSVPQPQAVTLNELIEALSVSENNPFPQWMPAL